VRKRLDVFFSQTMPLIEYYTKAGKLSETNGERSIDEVGKDLIAVIESRNSG